MIDCVSCDELGLEECDPSRHRDREEIAVEEAAASNRPPRPAWWSWPEVLPYAGWTENLHAPSWTPATEGEWAMFREVVEVERYRWERRRRAQRRRDAERERLGQGSLFE